MNKKIYNYFVIIILLFICFEMLTNANLIIIAVQNAYNIWAYSVFPSLFPFFVISSILIGLNFPRVIGEVTKPIMNKLFKIKSDTAFIFIMSLLSGSPSNAKYTKELYLNGSITLEDANKILIFTHFSSPLFILGTITSFLDNKEVGFFILVIHYLTNVIMGIVIRNYNPSCDQNKGISLKKVIYEASNTTDNISSIVTKSIFNSINTIIMILGVISISTVMITIINSNFNLSKLTECIISGLIEMTNGLRTLMSLDISLKLKTAISMFFISFGGLSVHLQVISIINDTKIKYKSFFIARIIHASIATLLSYILFDIFI